VMTSNREIGPSEGVVIVVIIGLRLCLISYAECPVEKGGSSTAQFPHERTSARSEGVTGDASAAARSSSARAFVAALSAMRCLI